VRLLATERRLKGLEQLRLLAKTVAASAGGASGKRVVDEEDFSIPPLSASCGVMECSVLAGAGARDDLCVAAFDCFAPPRGVRDTDEAGRCKVGRGGYRSHLGALVEISFSLWSPPTSVFSNDTVFGVLVEHDACHVVLEARCSGLRCEEVFRAFVNWGS
jgi:hypothetical protein